MLDEVYTIGGYFIAQKAALGHGKFRQWVEGSLEPALSYRTVRLYMLNLEDTDKVSGELKLFRALHRLLKGKPAPSERRI